MRTLLVVLLLGAGPRDHPAPAPAPPAPVPAPPRQPPPTRPPSVPRRAPRRPWILRAEARPTIPGVGVL
jgi:hypothetical protein